MAARLDTWSGGETRASARPHSAFPSDTEIVLATHLRYKPNWLVASVDAAASRFQAAGGRVVREPFDIPVGRVALVANPFENTLVLVDLSRGHYVTDETGHVTGGAALDRPRAAAGRRARWGCLPRL